MPSAPSPASPANPDVAAFVDNINEAFDVRSEPLTLDTPFQTVEEWDSLASVATIAMVYATYDTEISGDELVACRTVADILDLVQRRRPGAA